MRGLEPGIVGKPLRVDAHVSDGGLGSSSRRGVANKCASRFRGPWVLSVGIPMRVARTVRWNRSLPSRGQASRVAHHRDCPLQALSSSVQQLSARAPHCLRRFSAERACRTAVPWCKERHR
jgi:hypothetical protein